MKNGCAHPRRVHILAGCTPLAGGEYLMRHSKALKVVEVEWAMKVGLHDDNACWWTGKKERYLKVVVCNI